MQGGLGCCGLPAIMAYARLRGSDGVASAPTHAVSWERFWFDREPDAGAAASGAPGRPLERAGHPGDAS